MKHKQSRKFIGLAMALMLALALPVQALADYYIDDGDISVSASEGGQAVTQNEKTYDHPSDATITITQHNSSQSTNHTISISSENGATAKVTIENVNIRAEDKSGIDVQGSSKAEITVKGENTVETSQGTSAAVHVGSGELTLTGGESGKLTAQSGGSGAGIGSDANEDMTGKITIQGGLAVEATGDQGAGVGSGFEGNMSGSIVIRNAADVKASGGDGAGIGAGDGTKDATGNMSGSITIKDATVEANSTKGASIGSSADGNFKDGASIAIQGNSTVTVGEESGIGSDTPDRAHGSIQLDTSVTLNGKKYETAEELPTFIRTGKIEVIEATSPAPPAGDEDEGGEYKPGTSLYWATGEDGTGVASKVIRKGDIMTVTTELEDAALHMTRAGLNALQGQGVKTIVFTTTGATSSFDVAEVLASLSSGNLVLTHKGASATLTLGGTEKNELLK